MSWLDLHIHSDYSDDGQYPPKELMSICARGGVSTAALADHNSVRGLDEAAKAAALLGVALIPAIELDCTYNGVDLHVLGYWIDPSNSAFYPVEKDIMEQEQTASAKRLGLVSGLGIRVDAPEAYRLARQGVITGEIIAEVALAQKENTDNPLLSPYRPGGPRGDNPYVNFYWDYCSRGKPAYVPMRYISLSEAVCLIEHAGGIAVLAHPGNNVKEDMELLKGILRHGLSGIEAYSSYHTPRQTAFYLEFAKKRHLAVSCGSDFHGKTKPQIHVGCVDCGVTEAGILDGLARKRSNVHIR